MKRDKFLKVLGAGATMTLFDSLKIIDLFIPEREYVLPFLTGDRKITILKPKSGLTMEANAQYGGYYGTSSNIAQAQYWYNYQQAIIAWNQQLIAWQQYNNWLQQSHFQQMQAMMAAYQNRGQIGTPQIWSPVKSIYGPVKDYDQRLAFVGLNEDQDSIAIKETLPAADKLFYAINQYHGRAAAQVTVGPQSDESPVDIALPDASTLSGTAYATNGNGKGGGYVAVSNPDKLVRADNGQVGQLIKYSGPLGIKFGVV